MKAKRMKKESSPLYSKTWLKKRYVVERKTPQEIADEVGKPVMQVYRWLDYFGLRNK